MRTAYIGIGSNLPFDGLDAADLVSAAFGELSSLGRVASRSSLYRTEPVGLAEQPAFVNAVAAVETELDPEAVLDTLIAIERRYGRDRLAGVPKGPRTLDLDLLLMTDESGAGMVHSSAALTLPHPEVVRRRFVLAPLVEIAPEVVHPLLDKSMAELLVELPTDGPNAVDAVRVIAPEIGRA